MEIKHKSNWVTLGSQVNCWFVKPASTWHGARDCWVGLKKVLILAPRNKDLWKCGNGPWLPFLSDIKCGAFLNQPNKSTIFSNNYMAIFFWIWRESSRQTDLIQRWDKEIKTSRTVFRHLYNTFLVTHMNGCYLPVKRPLHWLAFIYDRVKGDNTGPTETLFHQLVWEPVDKKLL